MADPLAGEMMSVLKKALNRGKLTEDQIGNTRGRLDGTTDIAAGLAGVDWARVFLSNVFRARLCFMLVSWGNWPWPVGATVA